ncbi:hypothetical protein ACWGK7_19245 (plasmid) [Sphingomonas aurantiaca]
MLIDPFAHHRRVCDWMRRQGMMLTVGRNFSQLSVIPGYAGASGNDRMWFGKSAITPRQK